MKYKLDLTNFNCPLPLLMAKKALFELKQGDKICLTINLLSTIEDFILLSNSKGYKVISIKIEDKKQKMIIQK